MRSRLRKYTVVDLFSGAGGFSLGFHLTNRFETLLAVDNYNPAGLTYKLNFPRVRVLLEDVKDLNASLLRKILGDTRIDVLIGSPPCEPYTGANPRRERTPLDRLYKDPAGQLTLHYIRVLGILQPRVFVMENVPAIVEDGLKDALRREFERVGYGEVYFNILEAEKYGTPSHRRRMFVSNIKIEPEPSPAKITVEEALRDLPPPGNHPPNHEMPKEPSARKIKKMSRLDWGEAMIRYQGAEKELPNLIRLHPKKIAPTVLGSSRFIHPYENRFLTVREQARLMGFPDSFIFTGGRDDQYNMIGEAVPVPLAKAIGLYVARKLDEEGGY
ncbi:MAG: DNA cytosine methyltransferase [Thermosphaera sp.]